MKTDIQPEPVFLQTVSVALRQLKQRLQQDYEQAYPDLREIIHLVLDEEETEAWELSLFPHLLLPDLVEAHIEKLNLGPVERDTTSCWCRIPSLKSTISTRFRSMWITRIGK